VDPRFTRTSAMADYWLPLRAGSDLAFLGALINYTIANDRFFRDYVVHYTNAPTLLRSDFKDTEDLGGLFSGWDGKKYDPTTWLYEGAEPKEGEAGHTVEGGGQEKDRGGEAQKLDEPQKDHTLQHPRRVDSAAFTRQHRAAWRWNSRVARTYFDPGVHGHPNSLRHPAGIFADAHAWNAG